MTLRKRTLLIIGATLLGLNAALYLISSNLLLGSSIKAEAQDTRQLMKGVLNVFLQNLDRFSTDFRDWSIWDDTYAFIEDGNPQYIQSNLIDHQLASLRINTILFIHASGRTVFSTGFDLEQNRQAPIPPSLQTHLRSESLLLQHNDPSGSRSGILLLPEGAMMIASRPILNSRGEGPIRGTLIVGRFLNQMELDQLRKIIRVPLSIMPFEAGNLPVKLESLVNSEPGEPAIAVQPVNQKTIAGYALLHDIYGKPALVLRAETRRDLYDQGLSAIHYLTWSALLTGLVFGVVTLLLLERFILSRLARLNQEVSAIGGQNNLSQRVSEIGQDEVSNLATSINAMLTDLQRYEQVQQQVAIDLQTAKEAAETASRAKSQFLANMSHELRTPLNAIIGYSEMLQEEMVDLGEPELQQDLTRIQGAGKHLLSLINDILDLSKIEAGRMDLYLETFDLCGLVQEVVTLVEPIVEQNRNTLMVQCASNLGTMHADLTKVRQNLLNLLSNAAKFTQNGSIKLVVDRTTTATPSFSFQIADTGIGISPDQVANLFQAFIQADVSTTRKYGGTGLGLAITQRFCQMMGGDVSVVSELGQGSTFTMVLPATVTDPKLNLALPIPAQVQPLTAETSLVLIIDNDPLVHDLMRRSLNKEGFQVESAFNGSEGLYKAKALQPDVIILDVMLPEMDGWTVLATLKTDPDLQNIPVIMASILDNKKLGYTMGATDFLTKPIDRQRLSTLLKRYCSGTASRSILLVEDDPTSRKLMRYLLEQEGCQVAEAENGQIALNWLTEIKPELILLDLVMPELDGFGVIEALQANPEWRMIPIVVITSKTLSAIEQQQLQGCVEKIVQKGAFSREELLTEVQRLVTNFVERSTAIAQSPALNSVPQT